MKMFLNTKTKFEKFFKWTFLSINIYLFMVKFP
jgi:hypothetical protein